MTINIPDDPFIQELLPEFVDTWIVDFAENFHKYVETENEAELYRMAHTLKGSCFQFGLDDIANMGVELQTIARNKDFALAKTYEQPIKDAFNFIKKYLDEHGITGE